MAGRSPDIVSGVWFYSFLKRMKTVTESDLSRMLRNQAWERAKGELRSMLWTFQSPANASEGQFKKFDAALEAFIEKVEGGGLHE